MGISSFIKNKAKEKVNEVKKEREITKAISSTGKQRYKEGYENARVTYAQEGAYERGKKDFNNRQSDNNRRGGKGASWQPNWGAASEIFGGGGKGGGIDFWGSGSQTPKQAPPMRTTEYNPRTGKVKTTEPYERQTPAPVYDPSMFITGSSMSSGLRKKGERSEYDFIL